MSESKRQYPFNFGRVFFPEKYTPVPNKIYFQPLENHVRNVIQLVKAWNIDDFPGKTPEERQVSFERVLKAAAIHDKGKPQRFKLDVKTNQKAKFKEYIYSFRGHRYLANHPDPWVQALARGHHDFSVNDISRDTYKLKKESQHYADILAKEPLTYSIELYILEMCDQIEAELACRVIGDDEQADSRAFMDYTTKKSETNSQVYLIDPCPFKEDSISLTFKYWSMELSQTDKDSLQGWIDKDQDSKLGDLINEIAKDWWQSQQGKPEKAEPKLITLKAHQSDKNLKDWDCKSLYKELGGEQFIPNPMQQEMFEAIVKNDPAILLKSPTGSGKLEAILFPALAQGYRLILPLPARSLLEDQKERIEKYLKTLSKIQPSREISLVVDTGAQMYRWVYLDGKDITSTLNINSRRHLYKGDVILTTIDKFLYRYFAFGDKQKSFIFPLRINQEKTLICFDEAHTYDEISFTNFHSLVKALYEAGRSLILMTATMPPEYLSDRFDYLGLIDYVDISDKADKLKEFQAQTLKQHYLNQRSFEWISEVKRDRANPNYFQNEFTNLIFKEWQAKENYKIICVLETVTDAAAIYEQLIKQLGLNIKDKSENIFLYHGRIAEQVRTDLYKRLQQRNAGNQPYILITTSAIEVGCDLNCETLISQICSPENLIQRVGRCNRKGNFPNAKVILVGNEIPDFANSLDNTGWEEYKNTLQNLKQFKTRKIQQWISRSQQVDDYRVVELFSMLHEYVYQADRTCHHLHKQGLIPTRSWTPSVKLEFHGEQVHSISVPIDRLCSGIKYANTHVYQRKYDQENTRWNVQPSLEWGSAYNKEIIVKIYPAKDGVVYDTEFENYQYDESLGFVNLPKIFTKLTTNSADEKLLYSEGDRKAIITYTKSLAKTPFSQE